VHEGLGVVVYDGDVVNDSVRVILVDTVELGLLLSVLLPVWLMRRLSDKLDVKVGPVADFVNEEEKLRDGRDGVNDRVGREPVQLVLRLWVQVAVATAVRECVPVADMVLDALGVAVQD